MSQHGRDGAAGTGDRRVAVAPASGRRRAWQAGWALLAVTTGFAGWSGWWYWQGGHGGAVAAGRLRDQVLQAATQEIADLNTVNDKRVAAWEARWLADTTGAEYDQVLRTDAAARAQIEKVGTSARGTVTGAAVTRLSPQAGTAQVIAVVRVQQTADSGGVSTVSNRYVADLTRTGAGWKVSLLTPG
jgi:Mce-associated membrane protein